MALTEVKIKQAKARDKAYKLFDEKGLFLYITISGAKYWRHKYRFNKKEKGLAYGVYPEVSLKMAREKRDESRRLLSEGVDPGQYRQIQKTQSIEAQTNTFQVVALEWFARAESGWAETTAKKQLWILEKNLFPWLGAVPISELKPPQIIAALERIEKRGALETAHRANQVAGQVFRYAVASGLIESDPSRDLKGVLKSRKVKHHPAIINPAEVGKLMYAIEHYEGTHIVRAMLMLAPLLFQRPGELRQMEWSEINFDKKQWELPAEKMKMGEPHVVPLSRQALSILEDLQPLTGWSEYVFPNERKRKTPVSDGTLNKALRNLGYTKQQMTAHGFRAMARTLLDEVLEFPPHLIEQQISHAVRDPLGRAYNRTSHLPQRHKMMQSWADYLDKLKAGG